MRLPNRALGPGKAVTRRVFLALSLIAVTAALVYLDRRGYEDAAGDGVSLADVFYYVSPDEQGGPPRPGNGELVVVVRSEELLRFDDPRIRRLEPGDRVVALCARDRR